MYLRIHHVYICVLIINFNWWSAWCIDWTKPNMYNNTLCSVEGKDVVFDWNYKNLGAAYTIIQIRWLYEGTPIMLQSGTIPPSQGTGGYIDRVSVAPDTNAGLVLLSANVSDAGIYTVEVYASSDAANPLIGTTSLNILMVKECENSIDVTTSNGAITRLGDPVYVDQNEIGISINFTECCLPANVTIDENNSGTDRKKRSAVTPVTYPYLCSTIRCPETGVFPINTASVRTFQLDIIVMFDVPDAVPHTYTFDVVVEPVDPNTPTYDLDWWVWLVIVIAILVAGGLTTFLVIWFCPCDTGKGYTCACGRVISRHHCNPCCPEERKVEKDAGKKETQGSSTDD